MNKRLKKEMEPKLPGIEKKTKAKKNEEKTTKGKEKKEKKGKEKEKPEEGPPFSEKVMELWSGFAELKKTHQAILEEMDFLVPKENEKELEKARQKEANDGNERHALLQDIVNKTKLLDASEKLMALSMMFDDDFKKKRPLVIAQGVLQNINRCIAEKDDENVPCILIHQKGVISANSSYFRVFGYQNKSSLIGKACLDLIPFEQLEQMLKICVQFYQNSKPNGTYSVQTRALHYSSNKESVPVMMHFQVFYDFEGLVQFSLMTLKPILPTQHGILAPVRPVYETNAEPSRWQPKESYSQPIPHLSSPLSTSFSSLPLFSLPLSNLASSLSQGYRSGNISNSFDGFSSFTDNYPTGSSILQSCPSFPNAQNDALIDSDLFVPFDSDFHQSQRVFPKDLDDQERHFISSFLGDVTPFFENFRNFNKDTNNLVIYPINCHSSLNYSTIFDGTSDGNYNPWLNQNLPQYH